MSQNAPEKDGAPVRLIVNLVLVGLLVWWILVNREDVTVSFIVLTTQMSLWLALSIAAAVGALIGFLAGRRKYRSTT